MSNLQIDRERLMSRIDGLGAIGDTREGGVRPTGRHCRRHQSQSRERTRRDGLDGGANVLLHTLLDLATA